MVPTILVLREGLSGRTHGLDHALNRIHVQGELTRLSALRLRQYLADIDPQFLHHRDQDFQQGHSAPHTASKNCSMVAEVTNLHRSMIDATNRCLVMSGLREPRRSKFMLNITNEKQSRGEPAGFTGEHNDYNFNTIDTRAVASEATRWGPAHRRHYLHGFVSDHHPPLAFFATRRFILLRPMYLGFGGPSYSGSLLDEIVGGAPADPALLGRYRLYNRVKAAVALPPGPERVAALRAAKIDRKH